MHSAGLVLVENLDGDADGEAGSWKNFVGGKCAFVSESSSWSSGSCKLQLKARNGGIVDVATHSANAITALELPPGEYRAFVTDAQDVYSGIYRIPY